MIFHFKIVSKRIIQKAGGRKKQSDKASTLTWKAFSSVRIRISAKPFDTVYFPSYKMMTL